MSKHARSARGDIVDFDVLAIKQQLAMQPIPVGVNTRRKFIDEKDGIKTRQVAAPAAPLASALSMAVDSVKQSAAAAIVAPVKTAPLAKTINAVAATV